MKERPILFSGPMVRAILDGRKTQTRRVVKWSGSWAVDECQDPPWPSAEDEFGEWQDIPCKYGEPGDRLWVRETFLELRPGHEHDMTQTHRRGLLTVPNGRPKVNCCEYRADSAGDETERCRKELGYKWKPSIHMPRWASRINLEITAVRAERLNEISRGDCMAEGCPFSNMANGPDPRQWYEELWNSINGKRPKLPKNANSKRYARVLKWLEKHPDNSWAANPFVWVIEFRRIQ